MKHSTKQPKDYIEDRSLLADVCIGVVAFVLVLYSAYELFDMLLIATRGLP